MLIVSLYLVVAPIIDEPQIEFLYAAIFILTGLIFYIPFVHYKKTLPGMSKYDVTGNNGNINGITFQGEHQRGVINGNTE